RIPFVIGVLAANNVANGISGFNVTADSGLTPGQNNNGGTISIVNNGSGGVRLGANALISASALGGEGKGGSSTLTTRSVGPIVVSESTIMANGSCGNGGTVTLSLPTLTGVTGAEKVVIEANADGEFDGGSVSISMTGATSDLVIGRRTGFSISATGGTGNGLAGDGGTVT